MIREISTLLPKNADELIASCDRQDTQLCTLSTESRQLLQRYPTEDALLRYYSPDNLLAFTQQRFIDRCYFGIAPTLVTVAQTYGENTAIAFLIAMIVLIVERFGGNDKMQPGDIEDLAVQLYGKCYDLKLSELLLYFRRVLDCDYGAPYGAPRAPYFLTCLGRFRQQRIVAIDEEESRLRALQREEAARRAVPPPEHCWLDEMKMKRM